MLLVSMCLTSSLATAQSYPQSPGQYGALPSYSAMAGFPAQSTGAPATGQASFNTGPIPVAHQSTQGTNLPAQPRATAAPAIPGAMPDPDSELVVEVRIAGNRRTSSEKLMRHIKTRPGRPYSAELVGQDVRRLNNSGLVVSVVPQYRDAPNGRGKIVVFEVFERASIGYVKYVGNRKIKKSTLAKEVKFKAGDALEPFSVEEARRRLEDFYKEKGFANVRVSLFEGSKPTDQGVVFLINEGAKQTILWTSFEGNSIASEARLRTQIKSKQGMLWVFGGELDRKQIDQDKERLEEYYHSLGFFRVRVGCLLEEHAFSEQRDWVTLKFVIDEGPRYAIRNLSIVGNQRVETPALLQLMELKIGEPFNQDRMRRDQNAIKDRYGAVGHIFADVKPEIRFLEEPGLLDLVFQVEEGERYRVGKIEVDIAGDYPHTQITTVLNRLSLEPGDIIDIRELRDSQRRLRSSQLYKVDPQSGVVPEIAFSPPTQEEIEHAKAQFARRQAAAGQFRGQDPSGTPHTVLRQPPLSGSDQWRNLKLSLSPAAAPTAVQPPTALPGTQPAALPATNHNVPRPATGPNPLPPTNQVQRGQNPGSPSLPDWLTHPRPSNDVLRFQYSADSGSSTPVLPPPGSVPNYSTAPPAPVVNPRGNSIYGAAPPPTTVSPYSQVVPPGQLPPPGAVGSYNGVNPFDSNLNYFGDRDPGALLGNAPNEYPPIYLPLRPEVAETETGRFMFSAGVNSDAGLIGSIVVDEQNFDWRRYPSSWSDFRNGTAFRGRGQRFRLEAMPGSEVQRYMATFQEPYLLDTQVSLGLNGFYYTRFYREWDEQRIGGRVSLGYQLAHDLSLSASFRFERVTVSDPIAFAPPDLTDAVGDSDVYGFRALLTHDTRDSTFLATEGHLLTLGFEQVVGTYEYPRADVDFRKYFMLHERPDGSGRHVLSMKATAAYSGSETPIYEHYFAGGFSTLRGFDFRGASPRVGGVPVGGEFSLLASTEYMFPLTASDSIRGVVFCDTGAVQPTIDNWTDKYRIAPGFGLRITIPAMGPAPIALDFAFPMVTEAGDEEEMFSFFVGFLR